MTLPDRYATAGEPPKLAHNAADGAHRPILGSRGVDRLSRFPESGLTSRWLPKGSDCTRLSMIDPPCGLTPSDQYARQHAENDHAYRIPRAS
jgi:hypothetical protein